MKLLSLLLLFITLIPVINPTPVYAQTPSQQNIVPTPPQINTLDDNQAQASSSGTLIPFFSSFDWISNGIVFHTPNLLENTVKLDGDIELSGISEFRNIFSDIAIPLFAVITSFIAISHITSDNSYQLKNFLKRLAFVVILFILTPHILTYSIQFINLLNDKINIQNSLNLTGFIIDYINSGDLFRLITINSSPFGFLFNTPSTIMQMIVFIVSWGFFLLGFLYIVFQAIFRFIALLFLSVLFPLVLPFALSSRTENITNTYFKMWFTLLIQQPAFVLGFALVTAILGSILQAHGGNIGTLFLYSGSLIFLGGVNIFVGRIFGDGWSMLATNTRALVTSGAITGLGVSTVKEIKRGAVIGRSSGIRSYAGMKLGNKIRELSAPPEDKNATASPHQQIKRYKRPPLNQIEAPLQNQQQNNIVTTKVVNQKQGLVKIQGQGYSFTDKKSGLTTTYLSKSDALNSGKKEKELKTTKINHLVIDRSYTNKNNPPRENEYLRISKENLKTKNAEGILTKHYDTTGGFRGRRKVLRIYSNKPL